MKGRDSWWSLAGECSSAMLRVKILVDLAGIFSLFIGGDSVFF